MTHPRIFARPSTALEALSFLNELAKAPRVSSWGEADDHLQRLEEFVRVGRVVGPMVHDARIAALCLSQGVSTLWSADRDFGRFPQLKMHNPLVG